MDELISLRRKKTMQTRFYTLLLLLGLAIVTACSLDDEEDALLVFKEIAYNALTASEKASLATDWEDAAVEAWLDGNYLVIFRTTEDATLGPIRVVVDPDRGVAVEKLTRP